MSAMSVLLAEEPLTCDKDFCKQDAELAAQEESSASIEKLLAMAAGVITPQEVFDRVMYSLEPHWPPNFRQTEFRCSRWLVAARACEGTALWPRYMAAEKAAEHSVVSADMELKTVLGAAWKAAGLHNLTKHLSPPRHRHHSEKKKVREQRVRREQPQQDTRIRVWLDPQLKAERAAEQSSGIIRGTIR